MQATAINTQAVDTAASPPRGMATTRSWPRRRRAPARTARAGVPDQKRPL